MSFLTAILSLSAPSEEREETLRTAYLDIDGTLVEDGMWSVLLRQLLAEGLGEAGIMKDCLDALEDPARSGTAALRDGMPVALADLPPSLFSEVQERAWENVVLMPFTLELADLLAEHKVSVALVSGAPQAMAHRVGDLFSTNDVYACELVPGMPEFLTLVEGPEAKTHLVQRHHQGSLHDSIAIGNGFNDVGMMRVVGSAIAMEPSPRLRALALEMGWQITDRDGLMGRVKSTLELQ